jgi:nucleotidyltransferase/DNA polymerase involved in DNA repair
VCQGCSRRERDPAFRKSPGHVDLDQFFASVEVLRRPEPRGRPVVVGAAVLTETGLTCAIGIGRNKNQAKIAARFAKREPDGVYTLTGRTWMPATGWRPVGDLWGMGPKTVRKLDELG